MNLKKKVDIITDMCYAYRHDYGLDNDPKMYFQSGITREERVRIFTLMTQIFENCIEPYMDFKE